MALGLRCPDPKLLGVAQPQNLDGVWKNLVETVFERIQKLKKNWKYFNLKKLKYSAGNIKSDSHY